MKLSFITKTIITGILILYFHEGIFTPLHHKPFTCITWPRHLLTTGENFTMNYMLYPSGLLENPRLLIY